MAFSNKTLLILTIVIVVSVGMSLAYISTLPRTLDHKWDTGDGIKLPSINLFNNADNVIDANNQFALNFYSSLAKEEINNDQNIFFSPTSISTAFAIAYEGARENTAKEMENVFGFLEDDNKRRGEFSSLYSTINEKDAKHKLQIANALWIANHFEPLPRYVDIAKKHYNSEVDTVDFVSDEGVDTINKWVAQKTEDKIPEILEPGSTDELTALVITNAIYFLGTWENQFNPLETTMREFTTSSGKIVKTPTMYLDKKMLKHMQNEQLEIIELPYVGGKLSMLILLSNDITGIESLEESLTSENLSKWSGHLEEKIRTVYLPKFTFETSYDLKKQLQNMGIHDAFDPNNANFTGIYDEKDNALFLGKAIHKAFVDVNEVGTEAAAATAIEARLQSGAPTFNADHPFIFLIQDRDTQNILFIGRIMDPTA